LPVRDRRARFSCLLAIAVFFCAGPGNAAESDVELRVKAAYLLNFARFVEWPHSATEDSGPVVIAVLGHDPITPALEATVHDKNIKGRSISIRQFDSPEQLDHCDILFIPHSEARKSRAVLAELSGKPVLTVGEASGFLGQGGIVEFQLIDDTLRFSINVGAAQQSSLRVSSELLGVAYSITGKHK
jgi:hypothetical protein